MSQPWNPTWLQPPLVEGMFFTLHVIDMSIPLSLPWALLLLQYVTVLVIAVLNIMTFCFPSSVCHYRFYSSLTEHITALYPVIWGSARGNWEHLTGVFVSTTHSSAAVETVSSSMLCHWVTAHNSQPLCLLSTINAQGFVLVVWLQGIKEQTTWHPGPSRLHRQWKVTALKHYILKSKNKYISVTILNICFMTLLSNCTNSIIVFINYCVEDFRLFRAVVVWFFCLFFLNTFCINSLGIVASASELGHQ